MRALVEKAGLNARAGISEEAMAASNVLLLATPWPATQAVVGGLGALDGKILVDATSPILPRVAGLEFVNTTSGAEQVARWALEAQVVKAFHTIGFDVMENPAFDGHLPANRYLFRSCGPPGRRSQDFTHLGHSPASDSTAQSRGSFLGIYGGGGRCRVTKPASTPGFSREFVPSFDSPEPDWPAAD